jgi:hypothetical protein
MPSPGGFFSLGQVAGRLQNVELEYVQPVFHASHLGEETTVGVANLQKASLDVDQSPSLIQLAKVHNVCLQSWYEVDTG